MSHGRHVLRAAVLCAVLGVLVTVIACWESPSLILPLSILGVSSFVAVGIKHANAYYDPDSLLHRRVERLVGVCSLIALFSSVGILVWMLNKYHQFRQLGD
jgi:hypothetical protein